MVVTSVETYLKYAGTKTPSRKVALSLAKILSDIETAKLILPFH